MTQGHFSIAPGYVASGICNFHFPCAHTPAVLWVGPCFSLRRVVSSCSRFYLTVRHREPSEFLFGLDLSPGVSHGHVSAPLAWGLPASMTGLYSLHIFLLQVSFFLKKKVLRWRLSNLCRRRENSVTTPTYPATSLRNESSPEETFSIDFQREWKRGTRGWRVGRGEKDRKTSTWDTLIVHWLRLGAP